MIKILQMIQHNFLMWLLYVIQIYISQLHEIAALEVITNINSFTYSGHTVASWLLPFT